MRATCPAYFIHLDFTVTIAETIIKYMEQSHVWEANGLPAGPEIPCLLPLRVHYSVKKPPLDPILSPIQSTASWRRFHNIHFNIILRSSPESPKRSLPFCFAIKIL